MAIQILSALRIVAYSYHPSGFLAIYIYNGGSSLDTIPSQVIKYDSMGSYPSFCIADVNGDSIGDLILGDFRGIGANSDKGQMNIHYGTGMELNSTPDLVIGGYNGIPGTGFGADVSTGDINGDGIADLVVGAPYYGEDNARGRIYIYYGDTLGLSIWPDVIINGHMEAGVGKFFGYNVDATCDYNLDNYNDIIIGAYGNGAAGSNAGKVYIYHGGSPMDTSAKGWIYGEAPYQWLGEFNVSGISTDTTGISPLGWFGTAFWPTDIGSFGFGKCYMLPGDTLGEIIPLWTITGDDLSDSALGYWSCSAGYADNDKLGDVLSSALVAFADPGRVNLWLRRPIMRQQPDAYIIGRAITPGGDALGGMIVPAGDVDSCGRDEFLVSNYFADTDNMIWLCKYTGPDGVEGNPLYSDKVYSLKLGQNYPNPFKQSTVISYQATGNGPVKLAVYNVAGQLVRDLTPPSCPSPRGEGWVGSVTWDGSDESGLAVSNGVYIYKLTAAGKSVSRKMIILR